MQVCQGEEVRIKQSRKKVETQHLCSSKEKGTQMAMAAAAVAKLERFVHTPGQTPRKGGQQVQVKTQQGAPADRKSHGHLPAAAPSASAIKIVSNRSQGMAQQDSEVIPDLGSPSEEEPTLKDVFQAVNACRLSLGELSDQVKEDVLLVRQDLQKVAERTAVLEGRISQMEDDLHPLKHEIKNMRKQMGIYTSRKWTKWKIGSVGTM